MNTRIVRPCATALMVAALAACKDGNAPPDPDGIREVLVGVRNDSARLRNDREFVLALIPINGRGQVVLSDTLEVTVTPTGSTRPSIEVPTKRVMLPDNLPVVSAILMDNSGSMRDSDPDDIRIDASRLFWQTALAARTGNQVALLSFSYNQPSDGFTRTRLMQGWTADQTLLEQAVDSLAQGSDSDLYQSGAEVLRWIDATRGDRDEHRVMLLFTDGKATDGAQQDRLFADAATSGVTINTIGVGPASDQSRAVDADAVARLRAIADRTNGVYAGALDAAGLQTVFQALATSASEGELLVTVRLGEAPAPGTKLTGRVRVANQRGGAETEWSLDVK